MHSLAGSTGRQAATATRDGSAQKAGPYEYVPSKTPKPYRGGPTPEDNAVAMYKRAVAARARAARR